jgi:hypothetical protein
LKRAIPSIGVVSSRSRTIAAELRSFGIGRAGRDRSVSRVNEDETSSGIQRDFQMRGIVESYVGLLARAPRGAGGDTAAESLRIVDVARNRPVQKAVPASSARAATRDPALARTEQDLQKELGAQLGLLNNVLALSPEGRDDKAIAAMRAGIDKLRTERTAARAEIAGKFPSSARALVSAVCSATRRQMQRSHARQH